MFFVYYELSKLLISNHHMHNLILVIYSMKKKAFLCLALLTVSFAHAQLNGDGFYRVQNNKTGRFVYVTDDKGRISMSTTSADLYAIILWRDFDKAVSDPASVIYIQKIGTQYDLQSQGTGVHSIIGYYVNLGANSDGTYYAYATSSGFTKYLGDSEFSDSPDGYLTSEGSGDYRKWKINPIKQDDGSYFGVKSEFKDSTGYFAPFFAAFPFSFSSTGMKAYYVTRIKGNIAIIKEIGNDIIPASTPLIIKCASDITSDNKLNIQTNSLAALSGNILQGVYFQNSDLTHYNQVAYNPSTMRVLGLMSNGNVGFIKSSISYLPANKSYLVVSASTPDELKLVTEEDYTAGVEDLNVNDKKVAKGVYSLTGVRVSDSYSLEGLPSGLYIVDGKKFVVR